MTKNKKFNTSHEWHFFRSGGFDQIHLQTGADLQALGRLDPKLWAALSCPTDNLEFDNKTLRFIDSDQDGHIRIPEIIAAANWTISLLKNPEDLMLETNALPLCAIDDSNAEGAELLASAKQILKNLGKQDKQSITVEDTTDLDKIFANIMSNGDGIVPASAASETAIQEVIENIIACVGAEEDRTGIPGVSQNKLDLFFTEAQAFSDWWLIAENDASSILPFGEKTVEAKAVFDSVKNKIDDYFTRCQLTEFDLRAAEPLNPALSEYEVLSSKNLSANSKEIASLPLAKICASNPLPLEQGVNPAWFNKLAKFRKDIVTPLFSNKASLDISEWGQICAKFSAHENWLNNKQGSCVEMLGVERVRTILSGDYKETIAALIEKDKTFASAANNINSVEKLIRYYCNLYRLLNNFVSFRDFYTPDCKAIFQAGTLYIDGKSCDLCLRINDIEKHSNLANLSGTYLAYCECRRRDDAHKIFITAALTDGDADNLMVGRNGIFYDRQGQDWDATIIKIIEHPISVRQAFWYPFKRIGKMVGEQIEKIAAARDKTIQDQAASGIADVAKKTGTGKQPPVPFDIGKFAGIFAAIGLAMAAIGAAIASVVSSFLSLAWWQMPLVIIGLMLLISGPSVVMAYLKLRKRNLAPLLDGNGWAINKHAIINIPFGNSLTQIATLPSGANRSFVDPFIEEKKPWLFYLLFLLLFGAIAFSWHMNYFQNIQTQLFPEENTVEISKKIDKPAPPQSDVRQTAKEIGSQSGTKTSATSTDTSLPIAMPIITPPPKPK